MKKLILLSLIAVFGLTLVAGAHPAAAQSATATVSGKAVRWSGEPVAGATIAVLFGKLETDKEYMHTTTAADGSYTLTVPTGQQVWIHIRTFGTWWGYSYYIPFTAQPGERISQVYFAVGPRDVPNPITLPGPVSNIGPLTGANPTPTPTSNVKPLTGTNLPATGQPQTPAWWLLIALALVGLTAGLTLRLRATRAR